MEVRSTDIKNIILGAVKENRTVVENGEDGTVDTERRKGEGRMIVKSVPSFFYLGTFSLLPTSSSCFVSIEIDNVYNNTTQRASHVLHLSSIICGRSFFLRTSIHWSMYSRALTQTKIEERT